MFQKSRGLKIAALLLTLLLLLSLAIPVSAQDYSTAKLVQINGNVYVKKGGGQREFKAFEGMVTEEGGQIRTGENSGHGNGK
ncbi:MAG: hypothetical protein GX434_14825 [Peptococcaceae bacterium]|nr:hypothetical protein [Peptococcaceae bacterium]